MNGGDFVSKEDPVQMLAGALEHDPRIAAAYVYGSAARGTATPLSDVDVAIVLAHDPDALERGELLRELGTRLERALSGRRADIRILDELPAAIRGRIVTEGHLIVDRVPARRVEAEVRARMDYHDFLPFERRGTTEGLRTLREKLERG